MQVNTITLILLAVLFTGFLIQLYYQLFYFRRLAIEKNKSRKRKTQEPVSIIICAKNENENLLQNLPAFFGQKYPEFEVVVVNDGSVDETADTLRALEKKHKNLKVVNTPENKNFYGSKKLALTMGIKAAKYDWVLLTDADCKPETEDWITAMMSKTTQKEIVLGYGAYEKQRGILNKIIRFDTFYTALQYMSFSLAGKTYMGVGRNLLYRKELFFKNKGFASHYHIQSGDDDLFIKEVANKKNTAVCLDNRSFTYSRPKKRLNQWIAQKSRHLTTGKYYRFSTKFLLGLNFFSFYFFIAGIVGLLILKTALYVVLGVFVLRYLIQLIIFYSALKKLNERNLFVFSPILEFMLMFFQPIIALQSLFIKKHQWK